MKGLLLKDFYMVKKYCKAYLMIVAIFIAVLLINETDFFFSFYSCVFVGMIPVTLLGYDERSHWIEYSGTLPYTKEQIVSGKYIVGLISQTAVLVIVAIIMAVKMNTKGIFEIKSFLLMITVFLVMSCISSSFMLPFMFKFGVEKGRIAYYIIIAVVFAGGFASFNLFEKEMQTQISNGFVFMIICVAVIAVYALSWYLSIVFYKKREIS